jgi:phosphoenolpyruvate carboxykinase (ATP)
MKLAHTRAMIRAALTGALDDVETKPGPRVRPAHPVSVPGVPDDVLEPRARRGPTRAYDAQARSWRHVPRELRAVRRRVSDAVRRAGR